MTKTQRDQAALDLLASRRAERAMINDEFEDQSLFNEHTATANLLSALIVEDVAGVLDVTNTTPQETGVTIPQVQYSLDGTTCWVYVHEHKVYTTTTAIPRLKSTSLKYMLDNKFTGHKNRYYSNPKTVIKKITEWKLAQEEHNRKIINRELNIDRATATLSERYPNCEVNVARTSSKSLNKTIEVIQVKNDNGTVAFSVNDKGDPVLHTIEVDVCDTSADIILGSAK